jgi:hypothetical protein
MNQFFQRDRWKLKMHATDRSLDGAGVKIFSSGYRKASVSENRILKGLDKETARVGFSIQVDFQASMNFEWNNAHEFVLLFPRVDVDVF